MSEWKVPVQSLIDHIKTAIDVDPWAKEMAEEMLKEQPEIVRCKDCKWYDERISMCDNCGLPREQTFFCADGRRRDEND